jgi:hypothetical protein
MRNQQRDERFELVEEWLKSGMSAKAWCRKNQLIYTTFLGWHYRFKKAKNTFNSTKEAPSPNPQFIELKAGCEPQAFSGIALECEGVLVYLTNEFDPSSLRKCLNILRGHSC